MDPKEVEVADLAKPKPAEQLAAQYEHDSDVGEFDDVPEKPKAVKPAETPASPPPTPRKHPASLMRRALKLGARKEDIELTSTGDLSDWIEEQEIILEQQREIGARSRGVDNFNQAQRAATPEPATPAAKPSREELIDKFEKEGRLDPEIAEIFKGIISEAREAKENVGTLKKERDNDKIISAEEKIDDCFATLPEKYQKLFGSGTLAECTPAERKRRGAAFIAAQIDARNPPSPKILAKKLTAEADELFSVPADEPAKEDNGYAALGSEKPANGAKPLNGQKRFTEEQFEQGTLARATHRSSKEPKGKKQAYQKVADHMREMQLTDSDFDQYEEDGMPD